MRRFGIVKFKLTKLYQNNAFLTQFTDLKLNPRRFNLKKIRRQKATLSVKIISQEKFVSVFNKIKFHFYFPFLRALLKSFQIL